MTERSEQVSVVVLAAGEGTRMRSATPKVLHRIGGRSLLGHALAAVDGLGPGRVVVVIGHGRDAVREHLAAIAPAAFAVVQEQRNGTGHAVRVACEEVPPDPAAIVLVVCGDTPLLRTQTLATLLAEHERERAAVSVLTAAVADPTGYGRIVRDSSGRVTQIVEHREATAQQLAIDEVNSGVYAFHAGFLTQALGRLSTANSQGEQYLTDVVGLARAAGETVLGVRAHDAREILGVNDRVQLAALGAELNRRVVEDWMRAGVTVIDPASTWIDVGVHLEPDAVVCPNTQLHGATRVAAGAVIGPGTTLTDCLVGPGAEVLSSYATQAEIGAGAHVGPFSFLRPGTRLGPDAKAGAFVEIKNSIVGAGSKVPHLSYVGDAEIGVGVNIGAATVFVNYDGVAKHRTTVGDHVRVGSDTMLVAPLTLGAGSYTAAGSVITQDVPPGALAVGRGTQRNIEGWVERKRPGSAAATAAAAAEKSTTDDLERAE